LATKELAIASLQRTVSHFLFHHGAFVKKQHDCPPPPTLFFPVSPIKDKTDKVEVTEAESQAVLNTLTEHDSQDAFKKWQKRWERESQQTFRVNKSHENMWKPEHN
jgi:hypothetical protein